MGLLLRVRSRKGGEAKVMLSELGGKADEKRWREGPMKNAKPR